MIGDLINTYANGEFWRDVIVAMVAALILGLSGLILRKLGTIALTRILSVITLGSKRIKRGIYQRISSLHHSGYGEFMSFIMLGATVMAFVILFVGLNNLIGVGNLRDLSVRLDSAEIEIWNSLEFQDSKRHVSEFERLEEVGKQKSEVASLARHAEESVLKFRVFIVLILFFIFYRYHTLTYVNSAQVYFKKILDLSGPYITHEQKLGYVSRFTRIECKEDFEMIIGEMRGILKQHDIPPPVFIIW